MPVHVLHALVEAPPLPLRAARRGGVRAVEAVREDVLRHVDVDAADGVDQLHECAEVDDDDVVDLQCGPEQLVCRLHGELRPTDLHRGVDLLLAVARDRRTQVARNGEVDEPVSARVRAQQHHRVGVLVGAASRLTVRRVIRAEQQDVGAGRKEQRVLRREHGRRPGREPLVRSTDAASHREVARDRPDHEQHEQRHERHPCPALPRPALAWATHDRAARACPVATAAPVRRTTALPRVAVTALERHLPLRATALVDAVRLLPGGGHSAGYGTRWA